jgi:hypothetical protein
MPITETLTTNRENWSGQAITVDVDRNALSWIQFGYRFWLEFRPWPAADQDILGPGRYTIISDQWSSPLGYVDVAKGDDGELMAFSANLGRYATDPIEAAVKLLCNLL